MGVTELLLRIALSFLVLFIFARIMGRIEISQLNFYNFVSAIAIGSIAASLAVNQALSIRNGFIALAGWTAFTLAMEFIDIKSKGLRKLTTGQPIIVIKDGQIMKNSLGKTRLDLDALNAMLREKSVFKIADVEYAIFETSGNLSVMKKDVQQPVTKGDMNILSNQATIYPITTGVIYDGKVNTQNLSKLNLDQSWLEQQLQQAGMNSISDVFYAEVQRDGTLHVDEGGIVH